MESTIKRLKASYPSAKVSGYACDLSKATIEQDVETLFKQTGKLDHIVFTAGDSLATIPLQEATYENIIRAGQIRFVAPLLVAKVGSRYLSPGPASSIIFTTGGVDERPVPNWSIVASYAAALHGLTRNLALDLKPMRVNLVSPGAVDTEIWKMSAEQKEKLLKGIAEKVPTGQVGKRTCLTYP